MLNKRIGLLALGVLSATHAMANDQADAKGFVEDSHLNVPPGVRIVVASPIFPEKAYRGRKETGRAVLFI